MIQDFNLYRRYLSMSRISSLNGDNTSTPVVVTDALILNGTTVNSIESVNPAKQDTLISRSTLDKELYNINRALKAVDPEGDLFQDLSVISMSLVDNYFNDESDWVLKNWILQDNYAYCKGGIADNTLTISNHVFSDNGHYYCFVDVGAIQSGYLELRLNGEFVNKLDTARQYICELEITDVATDTVELVGCNISNNEAIRVNSIGFYYLTDRFYRYIVDKIKKLATITSESFITKEEYSHAQDQFLAQFSAMTTRYLAELNNHLTANNPHGISWDNIGAAEANHTHPEYITTSRFQIEVDNRMSNYAKVNHTHSEYLLQADATGLISSTIEDRLRLLMILPPNTISSGPTGVLPSRFANTNVSLPASLLVPSTIQHAGKHSYDYNYGIVTTNKQDLMEEAPKTFAKDNYCKIPWSVVGISATIRMQFHTERTISGYRLTCKGSSTVTDWRVISGNTTFVHRVTNPNNYTTNGTLHTCELYFDTPVTTDAISFILLDKSGTDNNIYLNVEFIFKDLAITDIGLTNKEFSLCIAEEGSNRTITHDPTLAISKITPAVQVNDTPLYIFAQAAPDATGTYTLSTVTSYIPVELDNIRRGLDALRNKYNNIVQSVVNGHEAYVNPAFGTLSLEVGASATGYKLTTIYDDSADGWKSERDTAGTVILLQTFESDNVLLMGYTLSWRVTDQDNIPDNWVLTVEGYDESNKLVTTVYDSVDAYYPFYSVEDDDIVYTARFDTGIRVKKVYLTFAANDTKVVAINKLMWYVSEHFYSIAQNTMYRGNDKVSRLCIGKAVKDATTGWSVTNLCMGKSCVIPINDLELTEVDAEYTIPNPFFTTDVIVTVHSYRLLDDEDDTYFPSAFVSSVTREEIKIISRVSFRYAASICRTW